MTAPCARTGRGFRHIALAALLAVTSLGAGPAPAADWPKVEGLSYLEMPDKQFVQIFGSLAWCRASVETPEARLKELMGGFPETQAKAILRKNQDGCIRGAEARMDSARYYGYVGDKEAVFDPAFWARLDEAREASK